MGMNMDDKKKKNDETVSSVVQGLTPIDPAELEIFLRAMDEDVIPEIVKIVEERRLLAGESRRQQLKC